MKNFSPAKSWGEFGLLYGRQQERQFERADAAIFKVADGKAQACRLDGKLHLHVMKDAVLESLRIYGGREGCLQVHPGATDPAPICCEGEYFNFERCPVAAVLRCFEVQLLREDGQANAVGLDTIPERICASSLGFIAAGTGGLAASGYPAGAEAGAPSGSICILKISPWAWGAPCSMAAVRVSADTESGPALGVVSAGSAA